MNLVVNKTPEIYEILLSFQYSVRFYPVTVPIVLPLRYYPKQNCCKESSRMDEKLRNFKERCF